MNAWLRRQETAFLRTALSHPSIAPIYLMTWAFPLIILPALIWMGLAGAVWAVMGEPVVWALMTIWVPMAPGFVVFMLGYGRLLVLWLGNDGPVRRRLAHLEAGIDGR
ncbi:MAG: hypothetical protein AAF761_02165 [Pseudomonadota bacterium]